MKGISNCIEESNESNRSITLLLLNRFIILLCKLHLSRIARETAYLDSIYCNNPTFYPNTYYHNEYPE